MVKQKEQNNMNIPNILWIDLFCGAGGVTEGIVRAGAGKVIICINHDANAIRSHKENHSKPLHFTEDVKNFMVIEAVRKVVERYRAEDPNCIINLHGSLECTNFSNAKGGQPRDEDSRTLALIMYEYERAINPDRIWIENVREFMSWGPMKQVTKKTNGKTYYKFTKSKKGKAIWRIAKYSSRSDYYDKIDLVPWESPISRLKGQDYLKWIETLCSMGYEYDFRILNSANYGSCQHRVRYFGQFVRKGGQYFWPDQTHSEDGSNGLPKWRTVREVLDLENTGESIITMKRIPVDNTLKKVLAGLKDHLRSENRDFLIKYYSTGKNAVSIDKPAPTIGTKDTLAKVSFMLMDFGNSYTRSLDRPAGTVLVNDKHNLTTAFLYNPSWGGTFRSVDRPCFTIIARMDKAPPYVCTAEFAETYTITINKSDSRYMKRLKGFMLRNGVVDVFKRMLEIEELLQIQGFTKDYNLIGNKGEQKKYIGNAVDVFQYEAIAKANLEGVINQQLSKKVA